jgi:phage shock protein A
LTKATEARAGTDSTGAFSRMKDKVVREEAVGQANAELETDKLHDRLLALGRDEKVDAALDEIKAQASA